MVDTRPRQQTLLDRFEDLDAIWPESAGPDQAPRRPLEVDDELAVERRGTPEFLTRHKWSLIALGTIVAVSAWVALIAAPGLDGRLAAERLAGYDSVLANLDIALPEARSAVSVLTDPAADSADLSMSLDQLSPFIVATETARATVSAALPGTPPLVPRTDIEALSPIRGDVAIVVDQADLLATRLGSLLTYRLLADGLFDLPDLPTAADPEAIDLLSVDLATALAGSVESVVSLPSDPLLDGHRSQANEVLAEMDSWRADYLAALRAEDEELATSLVAEIETALIGLDESLRESLAEVEAWGLRELDLLRVATIEGRQLTG